MLVATSITAQKIQTATLKKLSDFDDKSVSYEVGVNITGRLPTENVPIATPF